MKKWRGDWVFMNVMHHKHRSSGTETVSAYSEDGARLVIQAEASRSLFGTTMMAAYVSVSNLTEVKGGW